MCTKNKFTQETIVSRETIAVELYKDDNTPTNMMFYNKKQCFT